MKSRAAWLARGLGANSTTLEGAALAAGARIMRDTFALAALRRAAVGRSFLMSPVLVLGTTRPPACACSAGARWSTATDESGELVEVPRTSVWAFSGKLAVTTAEGWDDGGSS